MLALMGIVGSVLAGAALLGPFGNGPSHEAEGDLDQAFDGQSDDAGNAEPNDVLGDILAEDDEDTVDGFQSLKDLDDTYSTLEFPPIAGSDYLDDSDLWSDTPHDQIYGTSIGDNFGGNMFRDLLFQTDAITGAEGADTLSGGAAEDLIFGNGGDDLLHGGAGSDLVHGDMGDDQIFGGPEADLLFGDDGDDLLDGGAGDDFLSGAEGADTLVGGCGDDRLFGGFGADVLEGGAGDDLLDGTQAGPSDPAGLDFDIGDLLRGGDGDDLLILGAQDQAEGGAGADRFVTGTYIGDEGGVPVITDFQPGTDTLEVMIDLDDADAAPQITAEATESGTQVSVNGQPVAHLANVTNFDASTVRILSLTSA